MPRCGLVLFVTILLLLGGRAYPQATASPPVPAHADVLRIGAARSGIIQSILVKDGAHVDAGQVIAQLDCRPMQKEVDFRAASLAAAEAAFERVRNGPRPEEIAIGEAARAALERATALTPNVTITRAQLLEIQRNSRIADAQLIDTQKNLALLKAGSRAEDIAEAQARRAAAAAFLDEGKAELDQCVVRAPTAGTVHMVATVGEFMSVYAPTPIAQITIDATTK